MKQLLFKTTAAALALTALAAAASFALPAASADDPLVSLSYLTGSYRTGLLSDVDVAVAAAKKQLSADFTAQAAALTNPSSTPPSAARNDFETLNLTSGQSTPVTAGGELLVVRRPRQQRAWWTPPPARPSPREPRCWQIIYMWPPPTARYRAARAASSL